jgi:hypothetical protein
MCANTSTLYGNGEAKFLRISKETSRFRFRYKQTRSRESRISADCILRSFSLELDRQLVEIADLRYKVDTNHDIVYLEFDELV